MKNITIKSIRDKQMQVEEAAEKFFSKPKEEIAFEESSERARCSKSMCVLKFILLTIFVLVIGGAGGIAADRFALPYLIAKYPELNQYDIIKKINDRMTVVKVTENVNITEDNAIIDAIKKVSPSVVRISKSDDPKSAEFKYAGNGIMLTSNGYIITSAKIFAAGIQAPAADKKESTGTEKTNTAFKVTLYNDKSYDATIINKDPVLNLAIIKIEENNLPILPLANSDSLALGERIIIIDDSVAIDIVSKFLNDYKSPLDADKDRKSQKRVLIMKDLPDSFDGATVINVKGEIIGISESGNQFIPTNELNDFIKNVIK